MLGLTQVRVSLADYPEFPSAAASESHALPNPRDSLPAKKRVAVLISGSGSVDLKPTRGGEVANSHLRLISQDPTCSR